MRILQVFDIFSPQGGGSQSSVLIWHNTLRTFGIDSRLLVNSKQKNLFDGNSQKNLFFTPSVDVSWIFPHTYLSLRVPFEVLKTIKAFKPEIIHFHEPTPVSDQLMKFACQNKIKTLVSYHTNYALSQITHFPQSLLFGRWGIIRNLAVKKQYDLLRAADYITAPSKVNAVQLIKTYNKKVFLLPYPISHIFYHKKRKSSPVLSRLITIGRLTAEKNIDILIEMMHYLDNTFKLTVVGDGVDRKNLENKALKLNVYKKVRFTGWVKLDRLPALLSDHDIFVSASDFETFGIVYLQALAYRIPCVVFDYPVSREVIPEGAGILIKDNDAQSWAKTISHLSHKPNICKSLHKAIDIHYPQLIQFREDVSTRTLLDIYRQIRYT